MSLRRASILIAAIFLMIGLTLIESRAQGPDPSAENTPVNLDIILLIDNSSSMWNLVDTGELRIKAAKFLVDYLRVNSEAVGANYRVGVINFGEKVGDTIPLQLIRDDGIRDSIHSEEFIHTDFKGPLEVALNELRTKSFNAGHKMAVILFTDGRPRLTNDEMTEEELNLYFEEDLDPLLHELQTNGADVFVLGIGDAKLDRDNWTTLIPEDYYIPIASTTDLFDTYHHILTEFMGLEVSPVEILSAGQDTHVQVEPLLERIVFSFVKSNEDIHITVSDPSDLVLMPSAGGKEEIKHQVHSMSNPPPGTWTISSEGEGDIRYWVDRQHPALQLDLDMPFPFTGQPITITARLLRNGEVVTDDRVELRAGIVLAEEESEPITLEPAGDGTHVGIFEGFESKGVYTVTGEAMLAGQPIIVRQAPEAVPVLPLPVLPTLTPKPTDTPSPTLTPTPTSTPTPTPTPTPTAEVTSQAVETATPSPGGIFPTSLPSWVVLVAVGVMGGVGASFLLWSKKRETQKIQDTRELVKMHASWDRDSVKELLESLRDLDKVESARTQPVVEDLSEEIERIFQSQGYHGLLPDRLYASARMGRAIEQRAVARAIISHAVDNSESIVFVHNYLGIFGWPQALDEAIDSLESAPPSEGFGKCTPEFREAMLNVWKSYNEVAKPKEGMTPGDAQEKLSVLSDNLQTAHSALAAPKSQEALDIMALATLYDHLSNLMKRGSCETSQVPRSSSNAYLSTVYGWVHRITGEQNCTRTLGAIEEELKKAWGQDKLSYVDYLALKALIQKCISWALKRGRALPHQS